MTTTKYEAEIAAANARLAAAHVEVANLRTRLAAEHAASKDAQHDDKPTGRAVTAEDGRAAARARFAAKTDDTDTGTSQDSAAAGREAARRRFGRQ